MSGPWLSVCLLCVVCCQVEASATGRWLVQKSPIDCGVSECGHETSALRRPRPRPRPRPTRSHKKWGKLHQHRIKLYNKTEKKSLTPFWETHYTRCHITSTSKAVSCCGREFWTTKKREALKLQVAQMGFVIPLLGLPKERSHTQSMTVYQNV